MEAFLLYRKEELIAVYKDKVEGNPSVEGNGDLLGDIVRKTHGKLYDYFGNDPNTATWLANHLHSKMLLSIPSHRAVLRCPTNISQALLDVQRVIRHNPERAAGLVEILGGKDAVIANMFSSFIAELRGQSLPHLGK